MDEIAKKLQIQKPSHWGSITLQQVIEHGGRSILKHYGDSLLKALMAIYPGAYFNHIVLILETKWKREWFPKLPKYEVSHWASQENQKKFLDEIAAEYKIIEPNDWRRITLSLIRTKGGQVI